MDTAAPTLANITTQKEAVELLARLRQQLADVKKDVAQMAQAIDAQMAIIQTLPQEHRETFAAVLAIASRKYKELTKRRDNLLSRVRSLETDREPIEVAQGCVNVLASNLLARVRKGGDLHGLRNYRVVIDVRTNNEGAQYLETSVVRFRIDADGE